MTRYTSPRLNTLDCVLRFLLGREPTNQETVRVYFRLLVNKKPQAWSSTAR